MLHSLPFWGLDLGKVHFTRSSGRIRAGATVALHRSPVEPDELTEVDGVRVTTVERAITETICSTSYEVGVVLADAALRCQLTTPERLAAAVERHRHWRGSPAAAAAVRFADGAGDRGEPWLGPGPPRRRLHHSQRRARHGAPLGWPCPRARRPGHAGRGQVAGCSGRRARCLVGSGLWCGRSVVEEFAVDPDGLDVGGGA